MSCRQGRLVVAKRYAPVGKALNDSAEPELPCFEYVVPNGNLVLDVFFDQAPKYTLRSVELEWDKLSILVDYLQTVPRVRGEI